MTTASTQAPPAAPPPALVLGAASDDPSPAPTVKITAPTSNQVIAKDKAGDFLVKLDVKNWQTAMGSQHVHLILDNHPYKPIYDTKAPVKLSDLLGGDPLNEGEHVLVAFPSRANHESVKTKDAMTMLTFLGRKKGTPAIDLKKPMLIYSRPKGDYKGLQASHVIVDFQLANDTLAEGKDHVHITVTGPGIPDRSSKRRPKKFRTALLPRQLAERFVHGEDGELMTGAGALDMKDDSRRVELDDAHDSNRSRRATGSDAHGDAERERVGGTERSAREEVNRLP